MKGSFTACLIAQLCDLVQGCGGNCVEQTHGWASPVLHPCRAELVARKGIAPRRHNALPPAFYSLQKQSRGAILQDVEQAASVCLQDFPLAGKQRGRKVKRGFSDAQAGVRLHELPVQERSLTKVCTVKNPAIIIQSPPDPLLCCSVLYTRPFFFFLCQFISTLSRIMLRESLELLWVCTWPLRTWFDHLSCNVGKEFLMLLKLPSVPCS